MLNATDQLTLNNLAGTGQPLTKTGLGTLQITGGAFDGPITVALGTLDLATTAALGTGGARTLTVSSGATLLLDGSINGAITLGTNNSLSLSGAGVGLGVGPGAGYGAG